MKQKNTIFLAKIAKLVPFLSIILIFFVLIIDINPLVNNILTLIFLFLFLIIVGWWWWAVDKILYLYNLLSTAEKKFYLIKRELEKIKETIKSIDKDVQ